MLAIQSMSSRKRHISRTATAVTPIDSITFTKPVETPPSKPMWIR